jgi:hypothetical protein
MVEPMRARADRLELCLEVLDRLEAHATDGLGERQWVTAGRRARDEVAARRRMDGLDGRCATDASASLVQAVRSLAACGQPVGPCMKSLRRAVTDLASGAGLEPVAEGLRLDAGIDEDVAYLMAEHLAEALALSEAPDGSLRPAERRLLGFRWTAIWIRARRTSR